MNHKQVATEVLNAVGGKENVNSLTHCVTRLRFQLKDSSIPNKKEVEKIEGVMSVVDQGGQYQVVIGNQVEPVFQEVTKLIGNQPSQETEEVIKGKVFDRFASTIAGIFTPVLGILAATGLLKGLLTILTVTHVLTDKSGTYQVLYGIADTLFYFFPIFLGASAAKQLKLSQYLGMAIGGSMIYPTFITIATKGSAIAFLGLSMHISNYSSTVFPVIIAVWLASKLEKGINKIVPQGLKFFITPLIVLVIIVPLVFFIVGPAISAFSGLLAKGTLAVYGFSPVLTAILLGGPWILIVMFGLHWAFIPIFISNFMTLHYDPINGLLAANQFAMAGATLAVAIKTRDAKLKSLSSSTGVTSLLGVSEPALYGVLLPLKKPLIAAIISGSIGSIAAAIWSTKSYAVGAAGLFSIPSYINPKGIDAGFYGSLASMVVGFIVAFLVTYLWGYKNETSKELNKKKAIKNNTFIG